MARKLATKAGKAVHVLRKKNVDPVFGKSKRRAVFAVSCCPDWRTSEGSRHCAARLGTKGGQGGDFLGAPSVESSNLTLEYLPTSTECRRRGEESARRDPTRGAPR